MGYNGLVLLTVVQNNLREVLSVKVNNDEDFRNSLKPTLWVPVVLTRVIGSS